MDLKKALIEIGDIVANTNEINMGNYTDTDVKNADDALFEINEIINECALGEIDERDNEKCTLTSVKNLLPTNYYFSDENADIVIVLAECGKWCIVQKEGENEPYVLPLEFVVSIYNEGNDS
jgi:hypothetical protein